MTASANGNVPMVKAEGVCKNFGALQVLKGVTLEIGRGQGPRRLRRVGGREGGRDALR